jgi:hypothetical protein
MSAQPVTIQLVNKTDQGATIEIDDPQGARIAGPTPVPGASGGQNGHNTVDVPPGTYVAKVDASPIPGLKGKVSNECTVGNDPNVVWKVVLDSTGIKFSGSQNAKN